LDPGAGSWLTADTMRSSRKTPPGSHSMAPSSEPDPDGGAQRCCVSCVKCTITCRTSPAAGNNGMASLSARETITSSKR